MRTILDINCSESRLIERIVHAGNRILASRLRSGLLLVFVGAELLHLDLLRESRYVGVRSPGGQHNRQEDQTIEGRDGQKAEVERE
ncbi:hypothetical protein PENTCL1PPCAC_27870, partial [Pristionchus entomophagus]